MVFKQTRQILSLTTNLKLKHYMPVTTLEQTFSLYLVTTSRKPHWVKKFLSFPVRKSFKE